MRRNDSEAGRVIMKINIEGRRERPKKRWIDGIYSDKIMASESNEM